MQKSHRISGMTGAVALCALVAVLGVPFFTGQMDGILGGKSYDQNRIGAASDVKGKIGDTLDEEMKSALTHHNEQRAVEAERAGGSSMPIPIAKPQDDSLSIPPAAKPEAADPLQEWRQKAEARRLSIENVVEPPEEVDQAPVVVPMLQSNKRDELARVQNAPEMKKTKEAVSRRADKQVPAAQPMQGGAAGTMADSVAAPAVSVPMQERVRIMPVSPPVDYGRTNYYQEAGRDSFPDFADNGVVTTASDPVSTFSIDVDTASYSFVRRSINAGQLPPKGAVRLEELINYFPYNYELPAKGEDPFRPTVAVYKCPWKEDHKIVHIGLKGYDLTDKPHTNMVFLIDTSGSMNSPDKLPLAVSSLKLALESLQPDDTVGIVTYAGSSGVALPPTKVSDKQTILNALDRLGAGGSTAGAQGIKTAYDLAKQAFVKEGNNRVLLATDGDFNVGINNPNDLKDFIAQKRGEGIFLSVLGFGTGNYQDSIMQALAQNGNGNAAYIDNLSEARKVLVQEASATMFTIAKDVKIQVEFNPALVQEYRLIGYETRHLNREDFNNDKIDAGEIGAGHTVTAIYEITPVGATATVDPLRYGAKEMAQVAAKDEDKSAFANELAFLKMRYKRPDSDTSVLMTRPITASDEKDFGSLSDDVRFAAAVAGFGQLLRDSQYTGSLKWDDVITMAEGARGKDEFGYRSEFVNLARLAKSESGK